MVVMVLPSGRRPRRRRLKAGEREGKSAGVAPSALAPSLSLLSIQYLLPATSALSSNHRP
jgi:hypothetical protein